MVYGKYYNGHESDRSVNELFYWIWDVGNIILLGDNGRPFVPGPGSNEFKIFRDMNYINQYNFPPLKTLNIHNCISTSMGEGGILIITIS